MKNVNDLTGQTFGRLHVLEYVQTKRIGAYWLCRCICNKVTVVRGSTLIAGRTLSCGCLHDELAKAQGTKHGMYATRTYSCWENMKGRCKSDTHESKKYYKDAGIGYCKEWGQFENFFADMGEAPENTTLDRIDNALGYSKENCRWATPKEQAQNRSTTILLTDGKDVLCAADWSKRLHVSPRTLRAMRRNGTPLVFSDITLTEI